MPFAPPRHAPSPDIVTPQLLSDVAARFALTLSAAPRGYAFPGSPERCISRHVIHARPAHDAKADDSPWMVERLAPTQASRRDTIGQLLAHLASDGLAWIPAPLAVAGLNRGGGSQSRVLDHAGFPWQITPFIEGAPLPRPAYLDHGWRGTAVAACILDLVHAGATLATIPPAMEGDDGRQGVAAYVKHMVAVVTARHPEMHRRLVPVLTVMETLPDVLASQPVVLAHGDLHPLNIIWKGEGTPSGTAQRHAPGTSAEKALEDAIAGVIDWEFTGARPLLYDAANCVGCVGFEHPSGLHGPFVLGLVNTLRRGGISPELLRLLPDMVIASRFGWLSEWLRKRDHEMLEMELDYFDILIHERHALADLWGTGGAA